MATASARKRTVGCSPQRVSFLAGAISEHPALAALVELDLLEALPAAGLAEAQVELADVVVAPQLGGRTVEDDPAVLHDVAGVGDAEGDLAVLLHEQDRRRPLPLDRLADLEDLLHQQRQE